ncbi:MAG: hypothetical protein ACSHX8_03960 [Opitutaceae bacterium]
MDTSTSNLSIKYPALVIDGSGSAVYAGILGDDGQWVAQTTQEGAPLEELFPTVESTIRASGIDLSEIRSYIYCEGPGSVLGLRLCAMAIETWSRLYPESANYFAYNTLQLTATLQSIPDKALLVSDWKKGAWNAVYIQDGNIEATTVVDDTTIAEWDGALYHLPQRKGWQKPPANAQTVAYRPECLIEALQNASFLRQTEGIELYSSGVNTFAKWTPDRHRAS